MKMQMKRRRRESDRKREKLSLRAVLPSLPLCTLSSLAVLLSPGSASSSLNSLLSLSVSLSLPFVIFLPIFTQSTKPASLVRPSHAPFLNISCNAFAICRLLSFFISHLPQARRAAVKGRGGREEKRIKVKYCGQCLYRWLLSALLYSSSCLPPLEIGQVYVLATHFDG